ncbi:MAG: DUF1003 domain-containing protein [Cryobacterium sp.]
MTNPRVTWHSRHKESLGRGARAADIMRNGMGSWPFVGTFLAIMAVWAVLNTVGPNKVLHWDPYPFILLNLFLSMLAGLQGAILLIAAKRQDAIAAALAQHDYDTDVAARADINLLMAINKRQLDMIMDLRALVTALRDDRTDRQAGPVG